MLRLHVYSHSTWCYLLVAAMALLWLPSGVEGSSNNSAEILACRDHCLQDYGICFQQCGKVQPGMSQLKMMGIWACHEKCQFLREHCDNGCPALVCTNDPECRNDVDCCARYVCRKQTCIHCSTNKCGSDGVPCCPPMHCKGDQCLPDNMDARKSLEPWRDSMLASQRWALDGHEQVLRKAVEEADRILGSAFYGPHWDALWRGNRDTDMAGAPLQQFYGVSSQPPLIDLLKWHSSPGLQHIHFLRNYEHGVESVSDACKGGQRAVSLAVQEALHRYQFDREYFYYFVGHAAHVVADSFAPPHTWRDDTTGMRRIVDICTYGVHQEGVCQHAESLFGVSGDNLVTASPVNRVAVVNATIGLLESVGRAIVGTSSSFLKTYFESPDDIHFGYFDCQIAGGPPPPPPCPGISHICHGTCCGDSLPNNCCKGQCVSPPRECP